MKEVYLVAACRTPIGNFNGGFAPLRAHELGSIAIKEAINRAGIKPEQVVMFYRLEKNKVQQDRHL